MEGDQKRPSVFDRLGRRVTDDDQMLPSDVAAASHVSVIVSAPPAVQRRQSTSSESGSCTTTDEEEAVIEVKKNEYKINPKNRAAMFNRVNINQRRVSSPTLSRSIPIPRSLNQPSSSRDRTSLTPPHLRDKRGLMYDRHGNLRVPLAEKAKIKADTSRPNSSSPSTSSASGSVKRKVNSPTDYRQYYLEYQRSKSKEIGDRDLTQRSLAHSVASKVRSNRPPFLRQNSREGESPSHSSRPSRGSSVCSSSSPRGSAVTSRKSRLERSSLAGDVSPISASGSSFSDFEDGHVTRKKRRRLEASKDPESKTTGDETKKSVVLSDLSDGEFSGDEVAQDVAAVVSDLDSISDNELTEIIGETSDGLVDDSSDTKEKKQNVYRDIEIDWTSLLAAPKPDVRSMSARKRYSAANVLRRIGFSSHFAGESLTKQIQDFCQKEGESNLLEEEKQQSTESGTGMTRCFHQIIRKRMKEGEGNLLFPHRKTSFVCSNI